METVPEHVIEPAVSGPPPRRAGLPLGTNLLLMAAVVLFACFIYGAGRALLEAWKLSWLAMAGRTVTAHVQAVLTEPSQAEGGPARQVGLRCSYTLPLSLSSTHQVGTAQLIIQEAGHPPPTVRGNTPGTRPNGLRPEGRVFHVGDTLPLRCASWLGKPLVSPWQSSPVGKIVFLMLCGGLVTGVSLVLLKKIFQWRQHRVRLLRHGIATTGTIVDKQARAEDAPRYYIRYGYAAGAELCEREEQVSIDQWKRLQIGQPVSVLYDPERRSDAGLYLLIAKG